MSRSVRVSVAVIALVALAILVRIALRAAALSDAKKIDAVPEPLSSASSAPSASSASSAPSADPSAEVIVSAAAPSSGAPAAAPAPAIAPVCRQLLAQNERVLGGTDGPHEGLSFSGSCYASPRGGAWALRLDSWAITGNWAGVDTWKGEYTVAHLDPAGREVAADTAWSIEDGVSYTSVDDPALFDFDGDGEPELFVQQDHKEHEGPMSSSAKLYTFREGKVLEYPGVPKDVEDMKDADGDGRPDFVYRYYDDIRTHPGSFFDFAVDGPALLAHSLPDGTFSTTDAAAQAFARKDCPTPGAGAADGGASDVDPEICARLWGASEAKALALLRGLCPQGAKCKGDCAETNDPCAYFNDRARLLGRPPPLRISP